MRNFTGREIECEKISSLMTSESTRFVNIWGSPGFGKTSTAIAVAHHLQSLGHPVYFFKYRGLRLKREFISKLRSIFNSVSTSIANANLTDADKLCSIFREIPCRFFLVLDNLDDLLTCNPDDIVATSVRDEVVDLIHEILDSCPNVCMLTTTREYLEFMRLRVAGYESLRIDPLDQLSANNLVRKFLPSASEYIRFQVTKISGNVPLAIALLSPLIVNEDTETAQQILVEVQSSENVQENFDNPYNTGNETLKKLFDSSFDRLLQNEKHALISLSVFLGTDIDFKAAAAVIGFDRVLACKRTLSILVNRSFIDEDRESKMHNLHPLIQSFAIEKGKSEFNEVVLSSKIRFYNYYLHLFENLNEKFLTGKSLTAAFTFFQERKNIYISFLESPSHEGLCEKVFDVLAKSELFLLTVYANELESVRSLYKFAVEKAKEQKYNLAYHKLCICKNIFFSESIQRKTEIAPISDIIEPKVLCYQGMYATINGFTKYGIELIEKGYADLEKCCDQQILKCLALQLLALYYSSSRDLEKSKEYFQMASKQCNEIDSRLFVIGKFEFISENNDKERSLRESDTHNQPLILVLVCCICACAREFLTDEIKENMSNTASVLQCTLEVALKRRQSALSLLKVGDLALASLGIEKAHFEKRIQAILIDLENEKHLVNQDRKDDGPLEKSERQKALEERLAECYFLKSLLHHVKKELNLVLESLHQALRVRLKLHGEQHASTAESYFAIANAQLNMGDHSPALESFRRSLEIRLKLHGEQHGSTAESYFAIANAQRTMGDHLPALESFRRSLEIRLKLHGEQHASTADSYSGIADVQHFMGDHASAVELYRRALDIRMKLHGEEHGRTAESYFAIAHAQLLMGDHASALESYLHSLEIRLKLHGKQHVSTADSYSGIGDARLKMGDYASAVESYQRALEIRLKLDGEQRAVMAYNYFDIGFAQNKMGDYIPAIESNRRALEIRLKIHGEVHALTCLGYYRIADAQNNMGDYDSALDSYRHALQISLKVHGEQHITTTNCYFGIGTAQDNMGDHDSAQKSYRRALEIYSKLRSR